MYVYVYVSADDMDEEDFVVETQNKLNVSGGAVANDNDKFKGEDEEDEKPAASPSTAGSSAKKKKKTPIRTGNESLVDSTKKPTSNGAGGGEPMSREEQRRRQLEADAQNAADLFGMRVCAPPHLHQNETTRSEMIPIKDEGM